jgi:kynureninase
VSQVICQKHQFLIPDNLYHLSGHSLGPLSKQAFSFTQKALNQWKNENVKAWESADWMQLPVTVAKKIAKLLGATSNEVIVTDSTTVNLYKVLVSALHLNPERKIILTEKDNFPTDLYIAQGITHFFPKISLQCVESHQIKDTLSEKVAVLLLSHVNYRDSSLHTLSTLTHLAQQQGIIVVWDLSHSVGMIPLNLNADKVDFAVGCTYKYLNGGPGAPSFIYVNKKHLNQIKNPIQGWMAHQSPFHFADNFCAKKTASTFLAGTPSILSMKALDGALSVYKAVEIRLLREQSLYFSNYFMEFVENNVPQLKCLSPTNPEQRGGHLAFAHPKAYFLSQALLQKGILCDYRPPNILRISLCPLYLTFDDLEIILHLLQEIFACNR